MGIMAWIKGVSPIVASVPVNITKQDRDSEIIPSRSLDSLDIRAMQIGYCVIQRLPEYIPRIKAEIEEAKKECMESWNQTVVVSEYCD
mgnify:CR=1 FL=1